MNSNWFKTTAVDMHVHTLCIHTEDKKMASVAVNSSQHGRIHHVVANSGAAVPSETLSSPACEEKACWGCAPAELVDVCIFGFMHFFSFCNRSQSNAGVWPTSKARFALLGYK